MCRSPLRVRSYLTSNVRVALHSPGRNEINGTLPDDVTIDTASNASSFTSSASAGSSADPCMSSLRHIDVEDNRLSGAIPLFIRGIQIQWARLGSAEGLVPFPKGNAFDYPTDRNDPVQKAALNLLESTFRACELKEFTQYGRSFPVGFPVGPDGPDGPSLVGGCTGMPTGAGTSTCDAFGGDTTLFVPKTTARSRFRCAECPSDYSGLIFAAIALFVVTLIFLSFYAYLVSRKI